MDKEFFTVEEIATLLQMKPEGIRLAIRRKQLRAYRVSTSPRGPLRVARADLSNWLEGMATAPARSNENEDEEMLMAG